MQNYFVNFFISSVAKMQHNILCAVKCKSCQLLWNNSKCHVCTIYQVPHWCILQKSDHSIVCKTIINASSQCLNCRIQYILVLTGKIICKYKPCTENPTTGTNPKHLLYSGCGVIVFQKVSQLNSVSCTSWKQTNCAFLWGDYLTNVQIVISRKSNIFIYMTSI